jgi:hypothetical protein
VKKSQFQTGDSVVGNGAVTGTPYEGTYQQHLSGDRHSIATKHGLKVCINVQKATKLSKILK